MKSTPENITPTLLAKQERRRTLSQLPIEQKVRILLELQKMANPVLAQRGISRKAWKIQP